MRTGATDRPPAEPPPAPPRLDCLGCDDGADEQITTPVLSDTSAAVSKSYQANKYGMMGDQMDGHSFVLVNKDGVVSWRADYGGAPKYTMYMPVPNLLADISKGLGAGGGQAGR